MALDDALVWIKDGNCVEEVAGLCERFAKDTGTRAQDQANARLVRSPDGNTRTVLIVDGPWWVEQMRVHPNGWRGGAALEDVLRRAGI